MSNKNPAAVALGTLGGKSKSAAKILSSKENGKKGGKPKQCCMYKCTRKGAFEYMKFPPLYFCKEHLEAMKSR